MTIQRAGDVIPQVVSVDNLKEIKIAKNLFSWQCLCGHPTKKEISMTTKKIDAVRRCVRGYEWLYSKEKLKHIVSKDAFDIEGLGKKVIDNFWELKFVKTPADIFSLDYGKIEKLRVRKLSIKNLQTL